MARSLIRISGAVAIVLALAAIIIRQPSFASRAYDGPRTDASALRRHVASLTQMHLADGDPAPYIAAAFRAAGGDVREQPFVVRGRICRNVIARFGAGDDPLTIVGAHYDAFAAKLPLPGADDNSSGTAGLLELARLLGARPPAQPVELVAFANEEPPYFGSEEMGSAVHAASMARPIAGMICLEMIGYYTAEQPWPSWVLSMLYPRQGDFVAVGGGWSDRRLARRVKNAINGAGGVAVSFTGPRAMLDASDQRNYWARGWSAVMVSDTAYLRNPNYHTARDGADTLDYERMARVVDGIANALPHVRASSSR